MNTATITYNDGAEPEEVTNYDEATVFEGAAIYTWTNKDKRVLIIPLHRITAIDSYEV